MNRYNTFNGAKYFSGDGSQIYYELKLIEIFHDDLKGYHEKLLKTYLN